MSSATSHCKRGSYDRGEECPAFAETTPLARPRHHRSVCPQTGFLLAYAHWTEASRSSKVALLRPHQVSSTEVWHPWSRSRAATLLCGPCKSPREKNLQWVFEFCGLVSYKLVVDLLYNPLYYRPTTKRNKSVKVGLTVARRGKQLPSTKFLAVAWFLYYSAEFIFPDFPLTSQDKMNRFPVCSHEIPMSVFNRLQSH